MDWVKRNLFFVIGGGVALGLMGLAGYYLFTGWRHKGEVFETLSKQYADLKRLYELNPNPGSDKVDNIKAAKEQQKQLRELISQSVRYFDPVAPIPAFEGTNRVTSEEFASQLRRTVDQLQREAASASVTVPAKYNFSFEAQKSLMVFEKSSLNALAVQLGEVKALCDAVFAAKVNVLDGIRRERVSSDDNKGPPSDYLEQKSVTNDLAIITPYEITFRCFSAELAGVLNRFHGDSHCLLIKTINVEPAPAGATGDPNAPAEMPSITPSYSPTPASPAPFGGGYMTPELRARYGLGRYGAPGAGPDLSSRYGSYGRRAGGEGGGGPSPSLGGIQYRPLGGAAAPGMPYAGGTVAPYSATPGAPVGVPTHSGPQTVLNEKPLRVTALVHVVKLLPKELNR